MVSVQYETIRGVASLQIPDESSSLQSRLADIQIHDDAQTSRVEGQVSVGQCSGPLDEGGNDEETEDDLEEDVLEMTEEEVIRYLDSLVYFLLLSSLQRTKPRFANP